MVYLYLPECFQLLHKPTGKKGQYECIEVIYLHNFMYLCVLVCVCVCVCVYNILGG